MNGGITMEPKDQRRLIALPTVHGTGGDKAGLPDVVRLSDVLSREMVEQIERHESEDHHAAPRPRRGPAAAGDLAGSRALSALAEVLSEEMDRRLAEHMWRYHRGERRPPA
jgi:hypothetical protein